MITALVGLARAQQGDGAPGRGVRSLYRSIALAVAAGVTQGVAMLLLVPVLRATVARQWDSALLAAAVMAVAVVAHAVVMGWATQRGFDSSMEVIRQMHRGLGAKLIRLPLGWFGPESQGRASHIAVRGTLFVATAAMDILVPVIVSATAPATLAVGALAIDWRIGAALIAAAPVIYLSARVATHWDAVGEAKVRAVRAQTDSRLLEFARSQPVLRSAGIAADYAPLTSAIDAQRVRGRAALWYSVGSMVLQGVVIQCVLGATVALGVWTILTGATDPATGIALVGLVVLAAGPLRVVASMSTALEQSAQEIDDVRALLDTPTLAEPAEPVAFPSSHGIEFDRVDFSYGAPDAQVVKHLTLAVPEHSYTALVGPSGSGKTTLLRLAARLWDPTAGAVRIGGVDIRDLPTEELYGNISMIFQDVYLFNDTLWENIRLGHPEATDEEIRDAARRARVDEIVRRLPHGWDTRVGEGGSLLSGGERQRVSIARALVRRAPIVLCDEPSSALDPSTRRAVSAALEDLAGESTVVVVAHQLETIRRAHSIVLLDAGSVVAQDTHAELAATEQRYRDFWNLRSRAGRWDLTRAPSPTNEGNE